MVGYSGRPLAAKLGIKPGSTLRVKGSPFGYLKLLEPLPDGVNLVTRLSNNTELVHVFASRRADLVKGLRFFRAKLRPTATLWVSWPKASSKVPTDITEDTVRKLALPLGFVDVKVCAVTDVWSGLKLVVRKGLR